MGEREWLVYQSVDLGLDGNEWLERDNKYVSASTARSVAGVQRLSLHPHVPELVPSDQWAQLLCELWLSARHSPVLLRRTSADRRWTQLQCADHPSE